MGNIDMKNKGEACVLCAASTYDQKYYFNNKFDKLPESVKKELQIISVLFTEEVGGVFSIEFDEDGEVILKTDADEEDLLYDEIGSGLMVKEIQKNRTELFESLKLFYRFIVLGEKPEDSIFQEE